LIVDLIESVGGQVFGRTANAPEALKLIEDESIDAARTSTGALSTTSLRP
jgi:hypothetical protein